MYLLALFFPLLGAFVAGFFSFSFGVYGSSIITLVAVFFSFLFSLNSFYEVALNHSVCTLKLGTWFSMGYGSVEWGFLFDTLTVTMMVVVTSISFLVHLYSLNYMSADPHLNRFLSYLSLFTFFMLMLVTSDNFLQLFFGWEGVGLASYLLINFWHTRTQANKSAMKAMLVNRFGDLGLLFAIIIIYYYFKSLDFAVVFSLVPFLKDLSVVFLVWDINIITFAGIFLFIAAVGKSAQLGLHTWLPDAMEGPTPVSALIHAATMVTAGIFLILRSSPLIEYSSTVLTLLTVFGGLTAFFAATTALTQFDLKKVIAYSTCSQLGYMMFACGLSNYFISLFHLVNHAFFKALLFLSAGSIIHALSDEQDMRRMGGLVKILPFTYSVMVIGSLALAGFPFLAGFYSKDLILEVAFAKFSLDGLFVYWLGTLSAFFTAFYSTRLLYLTFFSKTNSSKSVMNNAHDAPIEFYIPLTLLAVASIFIGFLLKDMMAGLGTGFWQSSFFILPENFVYIDSEFLPTYLKLIPVIFSICGMVSSFVLYSFVLFNKKYFYLFLRNVLLKNLYFFSSKKWYFDIIYNQFLLKAYLFFGYNVSFKLFDRGVFELLGPTGLVKVFRALSSNALRFQSGFIYHYTFIIILSFIIFILFVFFINTFTLNIPDMVYIMLGLVIIFSNPFISSNKGLFHYFLEGKK